MKIQKEKDELEDETSDEVYFLDSVERSVRLFNQANEGVGTAFVGEFNGKKVWFTEHFEGDNPNDLNMVDWALEYYEKTGRLILDVFESGNLINTGNTVVLVDPGLSLDTGEPGSAHSHAAWESGLKEEQNRILNFKRESYPNSIDVVKALLFCKANRADIRKVDFLKDEDLRKQMSEAYDANVRVQEKKESEFDKGIVQRAISKLEQLFPIKDKEFKKQQASTTTTFDHHRSVEPKYESAPPARTDKENKSDFSSAPALRTPDNKSKG